MAGGGGRRIVECLFGGFRPRIFDVFEAAGVPFWSILGTFWEPVAPCGHLPGPSGARVTEIRKLCENMLQNGPFLGPFGYLGHPWAPCGSPLTKKGAKSDPKLSFVDFVEMSVFLR